MSVIAINPLDNREFLPGVDTSFVRRWSPRAMSGESLYETDLKILFEAARWAPSSYNAQPWRFVYALRETPDWQPLFDCLVEFNQQWAANAGALVVICSRSRFEKNDKPAPTHAFDTGAAWMSLALQGAMLGLVVHGMQGFDYDQAAKAIGATDPYQVLAMAAIGKPGYVDDLPEDMRERETPSNRRPLDEIVFEGKLEAK